MNSENKQIEAAPNLYFDRTFNLEASKIVPGEYYVTRRNMVLVTVLGSCVSACIRDKVSGIGGMNHFMLPTSMHDKGSWISASARYGAYAMEVMINQILKQGAKRENLEAKLFGGGAVIKNMVALNVGDSNAKFAIDYLKKERIPLIAKDLLGEFPRKIYYFPQTGKVLVKKLRSIQNDTIVVRELEYNSRLTTSEIDGEIELFKYP
jgi:chemotaxis protein CheD